MSTSAKRLGAIEVQKLGATHIRFKDEQGHEKVVPIATVNCEQGASGLPWTFCCGGHAVTRSVFNKVIAILANEKVGEA